jgi:hypothetical protein
VDGNGKWGSCNGNGWWGIEMVEGFGNGGRVGYSYGDCFGIELNWRMGMVGMGMVVRMGWLWEWGMIVGKGMVV